MTHVPASPKGSALASSDSTSEDWNYYSLLPLPLPSLLFLQSHAALLAVWDLYHQHQNFSLGWSPAGPLWYPWWDRKGTSHTSKDRQRVRIWVTHETNDLQTTFLPVKVRLKVYKKRKRSFASSARTSLAFLNCNFSIRCCSIAERLHAKNFHYLLRMAYISGFLIYPATQNYIWGLSNFGHLHSAFSLPGTSKWQWKTPVFQNPPVCAHPVLWAA